MKKQFFRSAACFALILIAYSTNAQNIAATKAVIEKTNALYFELFKKKDTAIVNLYTDDASLLAPNTPPISGSAALIKDFKAAYTGNIAGVKFKTKEVYGNGELYATEEGTWRVFDNNGQVIDSGKYLKLWKKAKQGWKIFRDVFNSDHKAQ